MHVRIRSAGQETWYHDVERIVTQQDGKYLCLTLAEYPHQVNFWRGGDWPCSALICQSADDVTAALRDEMAPDLRLRLFGE